MTIVGRMFVLILDWRVMDSLTHVWIYGLSAKGIGLFIAFVWNVILWFEHKTKRIRQVDWNWRILFELRSITAVLLFAVNLTYSWKFILAQTMQWKWLHIAFPLVWLTLCHLFENFRWWPLALTKFEICFGEKESAGQYTFWLLGNEITLYLFFYSITSCWLL